MDKEKLKNYTHTHKSMKTNELKKNSEYRSTYENQMHFHTLAINNCSKNHKKLN